MTSPIPMAIILVGPTAIGKTELSLRLAERYSCEIISVDSMQVYRYMDIGTAKASPEERRRIEHHLIDIVNPDEEYNAACFVRDATRISQTIAEKDKKTLFVGGTGLYLKALFEGLFDIETNDDNLRDSLVNRLAEEGEQVLFDELHKNDPESAARIHPHDTYRILRALEIFYATGIPWSQHLQRQRKSSPFAALLKIGLTCDREILYDRINRRVNQMAENGLLEEVQQLISRGYHPDLKAMQSIGYRHMVQYIQGELSWEESIALMARDTRRYAKRQYTWFRRDSSIKWFDPRQGDEIFSLINDFLDISNLKTKKRD
ncbi:tRNA (adenosine(37)-N6)-dimethylallyltransferase MiaA [Thermodesulfobacteriota bacterium]